MKQLFCFETFILFRCLKYIMPKIITNEMIENILHEVLGITEIIDSDEPSVGLVKMKIRAKLANIEHYIHYQ